MAVGAVYGGSIQAGAVTESKIANGAITADKIPDGSLAGAKLRAGAVTTDKLPDGSIIAVKLSSDAAGPGISSDTVTGALGVNIDASSLELNGDTIRVKALGVTNGMLSGSIDSAKLNSGAVDNAEFNYLDGVTTGIQGQLNGGVSPALIDLSTVTSVLDAHGVALSTAIYIVNSYSDPAWITSLATSKISLSTVTDALNGKEAADVALVKEGDLTANDFSVAGNVVSLDYTNGQAAATGVKGFLTGADWDTFNGKLSPTGNGSGLTGIITSTQVIMNTLGGKLDAAGDGSGLSGVITSTDVIIASLATKAVYNDVRVDTTTIANAVATKAVYNDVRLDTTTIANNVAGKAGLSSVNTFTSSQTITAPGGLGVNYGIIAASASFTGDISASTVTVSSITTTAAGVTFSTNVFIMNGNVGIGTTVPGSRFEVVGGSSTFRGSDSNPAIAGFTDAGGNYRVIISTSGNVGIGTANPGTKLAVVGLPTYEDNTAAASLTVGDFYKTATGVLMVRY